VGSQHLLVHGPLGALRTTCQLTGGAGLRGGIEGTRVGRPHCFLSHFIGPRRGFTDSELHSELGICHSLNEFGPKARLSLRKLSSKLAAGGQNSRRGLCSHVGFACRGVDTHIGDGHKGLLPHPSNSSLQSPLI
jgi:hypothetical protein